MICILLSRNIRTSLLETRCCRRVSIFITMLSEWWVQTVTTLKGTATTTDFRINIAVSRT